MSGLHKYMHKLNFYLISQSKNKGSEQLAHVLALEKTVEDYQCHVDQLEKDLVDDCVNDIVDYNLQLAAAKRSLSKAAQALKKTKASLGLSAQTDLHLLRNNKWLQTQTNAQALKVWIREQLHQRKFEFQQLQWSYGTSSSSEQIFISGCYVQ
ncbi:hypothetical protein F5J12DRAFT_897051 [Pisolithus orientalis]|uniref:uncharacterized protein n=1 Tax=Pisolithus orientalis TaxID=936130 RepID=UPI002224FCFF|nr:uncharacterized protein F5J12DRAFT_897051 [Pisolithus orientalis]KAI5993131.1 hypothetical protein F5J12DRAFT_897051 [Pisolithus orientalis]